MRKSMLHMYTHLLHSRALFVIYTHLKALTTHINVIYINYVHEM